MAKTIRVMVAEDFPLLREDFCDVVSAQSDMEVVGSAAPERRSLPWRTPSPAT